MSRRKPKFDPVLVRLQADLALFVLLERKLFTRTKTYFGRLDKCRAKIQRLKKSLEQREAEMQRSEDEGETPSKE